MRADPSKTLTRLEFRFGDVDWERATVKQYELEKDERVWRVFINGYTKNGFVVFEEDALPREELLKTLQDLKPEIKGEKKLTVGELIESSYSWNNILGQTGS